MDINELQENFNLLPSWEEKYAYIIDLGKELPNLSDELKTEENIVQGCTSKVWLVKEYKDNKLTFIADSDSLIVKGLIAILKIIYNNKTKSEIENIDIEKIFIDLGLEKHISINRRNGFFSMVNKIKEF